VGIRDRSLQQAQAVTAQRFRISGPEVVYETVDDETIIVNLDTGNYYDLNHVGAYIFKAIEVQANLEQIAAALCDRYAVDQATVGSDLDQLVTELIDERLIIPVGDETPADEPFASAGQGVPGPLDVSEDGAGEAKDYGAPVLGKYTDMQELLLLDPVHEVDETGWPSTG
jgi:hypothetical protein